jgi:AcrR family transcriptional regulator
VASRDYQITSKLYPRARLAGRFRDGARQGGEDGIARLRARVAHPPALEGYAHHAGRDEFAPRLRGDDFFRLLDPNSSLDRISQAEYDVRHMREVKTGSKKDQTRERILRAAARAIRKHGYEGLGVADVMKEAGLTHGGFYAHFPSRDALLAQAAEQASVESTENLSRALARAKPGEELMALVDTYLADLHVQAAEQGLGCALAAAGSEVPRQHEEVRRAVGRRIKEFVGLVERQLPGWGKSGAHEKAMAFVPCMVGTLMLARAVDDPQFSRAMRKAARELIRGAAG